MIDQTYNDSCRLFNGYRPCFPRYLCKGCTEAQPFDRTILLINLDAMGDVLMTTCALPPLRRLYPQALLTWLTMPVHAPLLANNPMIDRVWTFDPQTLTTLAAMEFDLILNVDKGRPSCALATTLRAKERRGFGLGPTGVVVPLNPEAAHLYRLGLDDHLKFVVNDRTGQDLLAESLALPYARDPYQLNLTEEERLFVSAGFHLLHVLWNQDRGGNIPISREMGTGLLGLLRVQVCTVLRLLLLGQSISALK
jgi:hypothetical protein